MPAQPPPPEGVASPPGVLRASGCWRGRGEASHLRQEKRHLRGGGDHQEAESSYCSGGAGLAGRALAGPALAGVGLAGRALVTRLWRGGLWRDRLWRGRGLRRRAISGAGWMWLGKYLWGGSGGSSPRFLRFLRYSFSGIPPSASWLRSSSLAVFSRGDSFPDEMGHILSPIPAPSRSYETQHGHHDDRSYN